MASAGGWPIFSVLLPSQSSGRNAIKYPEHRRDVAAAHLNVALRGVVIEKPASLGSPSFTQHRNKLSVKRLMLREGPTGWVAHQLVRQRRAGDEHDPFPGAFGGIADCRADAVAFVKIGEDAGSHRNHGDGPARIEILKRNEGAIVPFVVGRLVASCQQTLCLDCFDQQGRKTGIARTVVWNPGNQVRQFVRHAFSMVARMTGEIPSERRHPVCRLQHDQIGSERVDSPSQSVFPRNNAAQKAWRLSLDADAWRMRGQGTHHNAAVHDSLLRPLFPEPVNYRSGPMISATGSQARCPRAPLASIFLSRAKAGRYLWRGEPSI